MTALAGPMVRTRVRVEGIVQGVGFRPYVYRLARALRLAGWVLNDAEGVLLEVEGGPQVVSEFLARLAAEAPPLAVVERVLPVSCPPIGESGFMIRASVGSSGHVDAPVAPDSATCDDCLQELFEPADRRFRYPFTNCTNCGPRFTIVRGVPYDRPLTTMHAFTMCERCQAEYDDPSDRRFHAEPNACPDCGPSLSLVGGGGADPLREAADALIAGSIVAIKGLGGYHLACRADDEAAVARLRARKHREDKPFALMVASPDAAARLVAVDPEMLTGPERPIVLAPRRDDAPVAPSVAPGAPELGVMLPYTPLHHLLMADAGLTLVMTSGNVSAEPIAFRDEDAVERLDGIADLILRHDRSIETRTDDSVRRVVCVAGRAQRVFLRRSRGYTPVSLHLPHGTPVPLLACGAELKNTFCLGKGKRAWVSHHIGDLQNYETLRSFADGVQHFERLFDVTPEVVVHDLHPEYLSTKYALDREGVELLGVQHHHAHFAACLAEHRVEGPAVGAIFDGTGYGTDGTVWGGELLFGDAASFERAGSLLQVPMPGGERAIREPWRMACMWLDASFDGDPVVPGPLAGRIEGSAWNQVLELGRRGLNSPLTSSAGRLFDAAAALCGVRPTVNYEGQAAVELEALCSVDEKDAYCWAIQEGVDGSLKLDPREAMRGLVDDLAADVAVAVAAARFHNGVAAAVVDAGCRVASARGVDVVVLSGGVFQNRRLLETASAGLHAAGLRVLTPLRLPANDGGIAYGQAVIAATTIEERMTVVGNGV